MKQNANRVDQDDWANERCRGRCFEEVRADYRPVGVGDKHDFLPAVMFKNGCDFSTHDILTQRRMREPETHGHDFYRNDSYLVVRTAGFVFDAGGGVEVGKEGDVGEETDADSVDEEDRELSLGCVFSVPICGVCCW